jgi:DNA-binding transcriptional LysR family regulator
VILPNLLREMAILAPHASVTVVPASRIDLTSQIDVGRVDIALGSFSSLPHRLREHVLFEERDMMVVATDHPLAGKEISLEDFSRLPLLVVSTGGSEDGVLSERGLTRRTEMFDRQALISAFNMIGKCPQLKMVQPHFLAVPCLLLGTEMAAIVPASLAKLFSQSGRACPAELPWQVPPRAVQMVWHERHTRDPGHEWLRMMLTRAAHRVAQMDV